MADRERTWRNAAHRAQWRQTLEVQAASLWCMPVADIGTDDVLAVLRPMWHEKAERRADPRAHRARAGCRPGRRPPVRREPGPWRGHLEVLLPRSRKLTRGHHKAMPYAEVRPSTRRSPPGARLLRARAAPHDPDGRPVRRDPRVTWGEVDMATALWTVPAERMKAGRPHRVPLSAPALAILASVRPDGPGLRISSFPRGRGRRSRTWPWPCSSEAPTRTASPSTDSDHRSGTG